MKRLALWSASALAVFLAPDAVEASGDWGCEARWTLASATHGCADRAFLGPGNDTRVNLTWLLRDRAGLSTPGGRDYAREDYEYYGFGRVFLDWDIMRASYYAVPERPAYGEYEGSRCASLASGAAAFRAALEANASVPQGEKSALLEARAGVVASCEAGTAPAASPAGIGSRAGQDYLAYIKAADAFYAGRFDEARGTFGRLVRSRDRWIAETAAYMVARNELVAAQASAFDEWGYYEGSVKVDQAAARRGRSALAAYLKAYPKGRYGTSARGLQRRALWLMGDREALGRVYAGLLGTVAADAPAATELVQEIDNKLLFASGMSGTLDTPLLLATQDLLRMREPDEFDTDPAPRISAEEIAAQRPAFAAAPALHDFVLASHAFHVAREYRKVLDLIPDDARRASYAPLGFSRQVLRGLALEALGDDNAAGFWRQMLDGAQDLYQRPTVELALAMNLERHGRLAQVFAPDSPIRESEIRRLLLEHSAGAELLRAQAVRRDRPRDERDAALFTLLYKDLSRGRYAQFVKDLALVPGDAPTDGIVGGWVAYGSDKIPTGLFSSGVWQEDYPCPSLSRTAATLAKAPEDVRAQLCLGEFYRLNQFDGILADEARPKPDELGGAANEFGGEPMTRATLYRKVIADPAASADDRAYALYRAVWCYGPSAINSCGGPDVPQEQRKAWFQRLKRDYPGTRWAKDLKYYW